MKIDTSNPRLPVDRIEWFKHPFKQRKTASKDLRLGEELVKVGRKLYNPNIKKR